MGVGVTLIVGNKRALDAITLEASTKVVISPYKAIDTRSYKGTDSGELVFDATKFDI